MTPLSAEQRIELLKLAEGLVDQRLAGDDVIEALIGLADKLEEWVSRGPAVRAEKEQSP